MEIHSSWESFFIRQKQTLYDIFESIKETEYHPVMPYTLRFAKMPVDSIKVVILGQDPYPAREAATGRAFEVGTLESWSEPFRQVSLKNILRAVYGVYTGKSSYTPFSQIKAEIESGAFPVLPPSKLFESWEKQGVLLLNTAFTVEGGKPGSHSELWNGFTNELIKYLSDNTQAVWFLWGSHAASFSELIKGEKYISRHPMMCSEKAKDDFLKNPCFAETSCMIDWRGI